ncbi:hypothetical protein B0H16DRAFT_1330265 [Mycena metata]|uniref:Uncharacterized protein n=1 Tax=Mycena metata TaxID=1033252 RepID=A0AAD7HWR1_9AGAR|nr:hypothetical protein B0H16DRAFT_1330265 [Mycena metata]
MKLCLLVVSAVLAAHAVAQRINIGAPVNGSSVKAGSKMTVEVDLPDTLTGTLEVAIVIAFLNCNSYPCPSPMDRLGTILYNGSYHPQFHNVSGFKPPHQNFTVRVPRGAFGRAQLSVVHFSLVGAGPFPFLETQNVTVLVK